MGSKIDNHDFVKEQYKNSDNLNARINLHSFNINKVDWNIWFFEKMNIPEYSNVLEFLKKHFSKVILEEFNGQIEVDKVEPVMSYIMSSTNFRRKMLDGHKLDDFYKYIETEINKVGALRISTKAGMFIASNP